MIFEKIYLYQRENSIQIKTMLMIFFLHALLFAQVIFADESSLTRSIKLTVKEQIWLDNHPVIRYSFDPVWAPIEYANEAGEHKGMSAAYIAHATEKLGVEFKYERGLSWNQAMSQLNSRDIDILPAIQKTNDRQADINFTKSYLSIPISIFSNDHKPYIGQLSALYGKKVAVVEGYAIQELLVRNHPSIELVLVPSIEAGLKQVNEGKIDTFIGNLVVTSYYIRKTHLLHIRVAGETPYRNKLSMGIRKDWPELVTILEKVIDIIPDDEKTNIFQDWASIQSEHQVDGILIFKIFLGVVILFISFLMWNISLKKEIRKRKQAESGLVIARQLAESANQAKSRFLSSMSHELRTPLNSILGFSELIKIETDDSEILESSQEINDAGKHLLELINQVLDLAKIESGTVSQAIAQYNLSDILSDCLSLTKPLADEKLILVDVKIDSALTVYVDRTSFKQIVVNLLSNAIKYNVSNGQVNISTAIVANNTLRLNIADTGKGLSEAQKKHLFRSFDRAGAENSSIEGTGLGLMISKALIEMMNGAIGVDSKLEQGSCFWVEIQTEAIK
jgi:two-component system sensor histidine kinase EvgS